MLNTKLKDRTLWFDGDTSVEPEAVEQTIEKGLDTSRLFVTTLTPAIKQFNSLVSNDKKLLVKDSVGDFDFSWNIPEQFLTLNVEKFVQDKLFGELSRNGWLENVIAATYAKRTVRELNLYKSMGLYDVLRTIIYIINTLESKNIVWGVGRGSSVHSYVLYLIGVHDVDSVMYNLDIEDFLRHEG